VNTIIVQVRDRARGNVSAPMMLWSLVIAVVLFMLEARLGSLWSVAWVGIGATAMFGAYLGWHRRVAAAFVAPMVSWFVAWFPLVVASMIHDGILKGLVVGVFWVTIGWILIAVTEFLGLLLAATLVRLLRGSAGPREPDVALFGPGGDER
jgi:hypothetical protein